ncbi:hypothetical protein A1Q1_02899 [Trichosporon asahii var. asahii CBS 2479]|uniref:Uncharacterized protein n=1 Tax=Trichosporon asahii var. asahii (strain ATCC 90039 / CBS 2479 / JCM 2466 / KCTC 7840 / NBRC 103889/ NCYC 2677 / UAMH 7654) TaxID=1186058 RepID=J4UBG3_TRIAS|nr:hypothetical protein A1Q1_02899 [Trichosporon asahii var. asahii CBS 2479]EJT48195.1 hypothetical protein A1Q1_02899 [Trichosporon asahii var. asahii CBS 2479]
MAVVACGTGDLVINAADASGDSARENVEPRPHADSSIDRLSSTNVQDAGPLHRSAETLATVPADPICDRLAAAVEPLEASLGLAVLAILLIFPATITSVPIVHPLAPVPIGPSTGTPAPRTGSLPLPFPHPRAAKLTTTLCWTSPSHTTAPGRRETDSNVAPSAADSWVPAGTMTVLFSSSKVMALADEVVQRRQAPLGPSSVHSKWPPGAAPRAVAARAPRGTNAEARRMI